MTQRRHDDSGNTWVRRAVAVVAALVAVLVVLPEAAASATTYSGYYVTGGAGYTISETSTGNPAQWNFSVMFPGGTSGNYQIQGFCSTDPTTGAGSSLGYSASVNGGNLTSASYGPWTDTTTCAAGQTLYRLTITSNSDSVLRVDWHRVPPNIPSTCSGTQWTDLQAAYAGGNVSFSVKYSGTPAVGSGGLNVYVPDPGAPTSGSGVNGVLHPVTGYPGYYSGKWAQASAPVSARIAIAGTETCFTVVSLFGTGGDVVAGPTTYGATDSDGSTDCGFNPYCYFKAALRAAFVPSASTLLGWQSIESTALSRPPFSLVAGGLSYMTTAVSELTSTRSCTAVDENRMCLDLHLDLPGVYHDGVTPTNNFDLLGTAANLVSTNAWMHAAYELAEVAIWVGCFIWIWQRVSASYGGKD